MKHYRSNLISLICLFLLCGCLAKNRVAMPLDKAGLMATSLPQLEAGLVWATFKNIAIPVPSIWNQFSQDSTFVSSVESIQKEGVFETGLTIQVIENIQNRFNAPASVAALSFYRNVKEDKDNTIVTSSYDEKNGIKIFAFTYKNEPDLVKPITVRKIIMADDSTSILDVLTFESPSKSWEIYWDRYGKNMFNRIMLFESTLKSGEKMTKPVATSQ